MAISLEEIVRDFAHGIKLADAEKPVAVSSRSEKKYRPGIGPHTEASTIKLVYAQLQKRYPEKYVNRWKTGVAYPDLKRQKCDLCLGEESKWEWAIEVKMLRFLGDNGKVNDNILMHILSPYPAHRSALTDCRKLLQSPLGNHKAVLIYGFDHEQWSLTPAVDAFERLAELEAKIGDRRASSFDGLVHPVHKVGRVFAWELK